MPPLLLHHHKCLCCEDLFHPSKRHPNQRFCAKPECRKASKVRSQRQWLKLHPGYFRGTEHVERVRAWRAANPGYSRRNAPKPEAPQSPDGLQDLVHDQVPQPQAVAPDKEGPSRDFSQKQERAATAESCNDVALQDLVLMQGPLVVGLISVIAGDALQDSFIPFAQHLVERGQRVLGQSVHGFGRSRASQTTNST